MSGTATSTSSLAAVAAGVATGAGSLGASTAGAGISTTGAAGASSAGAVSLIPLKRHLSETSEIQPYLSNQIDT